MDHRFFDRPILNSPYTYPESHWQLDETGQPTGEVIDRRRRAEFITPIPKPRKRRAAGTQREMVFDEGLGLSTERQQYDPTSIINQLRQRVDVWRELKNPSQWHVTPETERLLQHWRHHPFADKRPFFCQVEAVETLIWLTEVAPQAGKDGRRFLEHLDAANAGANPGLVRLALKLATGAGKTTVMAMIVAWQTINAVRRPGSGRVLVLNDEAHHCYREKPVEEDDEGDLKGDDREEAEKNREAARLWISGLEAVTRKLGVQRIVDLSATPFFLRGSGYAEGTLFPWTMSDFSLMDAIECGIVKLPRVPVAEYISGFRRENPDGTPVVENGRLALFRNFDEDGRPLGRPRTLLIDSEQLESGGALDDNFRRLAADEIDRFRRQSYDLYEEGCFNVEYADVLGIPFDFNAKPAVAPPQPPRPTVRVRAVTPERDACEIRSRHRVAPGPRRGRDSRADR